MEEELRHRHRVAVGGTVRPLTSLNGYSLHGFEGLSSGSRGANSEVNLNSLS